MLCHNIIKRYDPKHSDLIINLIDEEDDTDVISVPTHRAILSLVCPFFDKLLGIFQEGQQTSIKVRVRNVHVAYDLIMSFYGQTTNSGNLPQWLHRLEVAKCSDYFGLVVDKMLFYDVCRPMSIPVEGFALLLDVINTIGCDHHMIKLVEVNFPADFRRETVSPDLFATLMAHSRQIYLFTIYDVYATHSYVDLQVLDSSLSVPNELILPRYHLMAMTSNHKQFAYVSSGKIEVYSYNDMKQHLEIKLTLRIGEKTALDIIAMCFSADDTLLITGDQYQNINIYDTITGSLQITFATGVSKIAVIYGMNPDLIISIGTDATISLWYLTEKEIKSIRVFDIDTKEAPITAVSPDRQYVVICSNDIETDNVKIFAVKSVGIISQFTSRHKITSCCFSHDHQTLCLGTQIHTVDVYHMPTLQLKQTLAYPWRTPISITLLYFLPGDIRLCVGTGLEYVHIWHLPDSEYHYRRIGKASLVRTLDYMIVDTSLTRRLERN